MQENTTLVIGGNGKTGRRVAQRLEARGRRVRVGSRSAAIPFDWEDPSTWRRALEKIDSAYVTYYPDLAVAGAAEQIGAVADLAKSSGVRRLVLLSGRGEPEAQRSEGFVQASGLEWTIVRSSFFAQNFSESFFVDAIRGGEVALPVANIGEPFIDVEDIADVAAAALTEEDHTGQVYEVTGPRLLTFAEAIEQIGRASGREVRYVPVTAEQYAAALAAQGVPAAFIDLLTFLFTEVVDGRNAHVTDGVRRALGREPGDFADYARDAAATGVWN